MYLFQSRDSGTVACLCNPMCLKQINAVADPRFHEGRPRSQNLGCEPIIWPNISQKLHENKRNWYANLLFGQIFPKNCMKIKESGPRSIPSAPLDPLMNNTVFLIPRSILHYKVRSFAFMEQECIPVGCVPTVAVATSGGGGLELGGMLTCGGEGCLITCVGGGV